MTATAIDIRLGAVHSGLWLPGVRVVERVSHRDQNASLVRTCGNHEFALTAARVGLACLWRRGAGRTAVPGDGITLTLTGGDVATFAHLNPEDSIELGERLKAAALAVNPASVGYETTSLNQRELVELSGGTA